MRRLLFIFLLVFPLAAQAQDDDKGILTRFLENNLSDGERSVTINGFEGALSSRATIDEIIVADAQGPWLTMRGLVLDWNRAAVLRGRIQIQELSAEEILLPRLAQSEATAVPDPAASEPFSLPDLPVSINIGRIAAARVLIGAPILGQEVEVTAGGALSLVSGDGTADITVSRTDGQTGVFDLAAAFESGTEQLSIDLSLEEGPAGIAATLLNLPGAPPVALTIAGDGPLSDFTSDVRLTTDGEERLAGRVTLTATTAEGADQPTRGFDVDLSGDLAPVLAPDYRPFFGDEIALRATGSRSPDGITDLTTLDLTAAAITLNGSARIGADGLPLAFDLDGEIAQGGEPVRLPLGGEPTTLTRAAITAQFDHEAGDAWTADITVAGLSAGAVTLDAATLDGSGTISRPNADTPARVTARAEFSATGFGHDDPALVTALGTDFTGFADFAWQAGQNLALNALTLDGSGYGLTASATVDGLDAQFAIDGQADARFDDLSRLADLTGQPLSGAAAFTLDGRYEALTGAFDIAAQATGDDIAIGNAEIDRLLAGQSAVTLDAVRDTEGLRISRLDIAAQELSASLTGNLAAVDSAFDLTATLTEIGPYAPGLRGPLTLDGRAEQRGTGWDVTFDAKGPGNTDAAIRARLDDLQGAFTVDGQVTATVGALAAYADLVGQPISGGARVRIDGSAAINEQHFDVTVQGGATDLGIGQEVVDRLLAGESTLSIDASGTGREIDLDRFEIAAPELSISGAGRLRDTGSAFDLDARLRDAATVLPDLSGPVTLTGTAAQDGPDWDVDLRATAPGDTTATVTARIADLDGDITITGRAGADIGTLVPYSGIANTRLSGALAFEAEGTGTVATRAFDVTADLTGQNLSIGNADLDRLLGGESRVTFSAESDGSKITLREANAQTALLRADASGEIEGTRARLDLDATLSDLGAFVPGFPGAATVTGRVSRDGGPWRIDAKAAGPGATDVTLGGTANSAFDRLDLTLTGGAALGLVNRFIAPRAADGRITFDLAVNGPPALNSVSGTVRTSDARVALPTLDFALTNIGATATLGGGRATVDLTSQARSGGTISVQGPVTLSAPFNADLAIALRSVGLIDPNLYETTVSGDLRLTGPVATGLLSGRLALGRTEVQVPSTGLGAGGYVPDMTHLAEPPEVRATRARAGLLDTGNGSGDGTGSDSGLRLDIFVDASEPIFIRGRGLDAELGGSLQVTGTTGRVVPVGRFDLRRGRLDILGERLTLLEGYAQLQGDFVPFIRLVATAAAAEAVIRIIVEGPADDPRITFSSEPELPEDEVLSQLLFGRSISNLSVLQAAQLASAVATLAGRGGAGVVGRIRNTFGLDDFDVSSSEDGTTAVRAGKYLSENIYSDVVIDENGESEVNLNLDIRPGLTARGSASSSGDTSVGIFFERDY